MGKTENFTVRVPLSWIEAIEARYGDYSSFHVLHKWIEEGYERDILYVDSCRFCCRDDQIPTLDSCVCGTFLPTPQDYAGLATYEIEGDLYVIEESVITE